MLPAFFIDRLFLRIDKLASGKHNPAHALGVVSLVSTGGEIGGANRVSQIRKELGHA
jgi:hypothetical protein